MGYIGVFQASCLRLIAAAAKVLASSPGNTSSIVAEAQPMVTLVATDKSPVAIPERACSGQEALNMYLEMPASLSSSMRFKRAHA